MARFEERDPRWIVAERTDGTNVKNWHWSEKDCTAWMKRRLAELLGTCSLVKNASVRVDTTGVQSVTGEAFVNNRKNKLFANYDLTVKIGYCGEVLEEGEVKSKAEGIIEVPNLSDEQEISEWQFRIIPSQENADGQLIKDAIVESGREKLRSLLTKVVQELKDGVAVKQLSDDDVTVEAKQHQDRTVHASEKSVKTPSSMHSEGLHELNLVEKYHANPQDIFDCFTIAGKLQAFTQSPAKVVDAKEGGAFSWFDGTISGRFIEISAPSMLRFDWRFNNWSENHFSQVTLALENPESGLTILRLHQTKIPEEDKYGHASVLEVTENGWKNQIFTRIKAIFGYGI